MREASQEKKSTGKLFWWLKLDKAFFDDLPMKRLRKMKNGAEMVLIYQNMMILSLSNGGQIEYQHIYETFAEEIAESINEPNERRVEETLKNLETMGVINISGDILTIPDVSNRTGKITDSGIRMQRHRASQSDRKTSQSSKKVQKRDTEKEKELEPEKEQEKEKEKEPDQDQEKEKEKEGKSGRLVGNADGNITRPEIFHRMQQLSIQTFDCHEFWEHYQGQTINDLDALLKKWDDNRSNRIPAAG